MQKGHVEGFWRRGQLPVPPGADVTVAGSDPVIGARHRIGEAAACASALLGCWAARFHERRGGSPQSVRVDVAHATASLLSFLLQRCDKIDLRRIHHPVTGIYQASDGRWIHLHGGFPHLAKRSLKLLGAESTVRSIAAKVAEWTADDLENAMADNGLCSAVVRSPAEWQQHPQGRSVSLLPAVKITKVGEAEPRRRSQAHRPLDGVRVADMTRVLAGPSCGRALASHGADVLRIASPNLASIEPFVIDTGRGKRSAFVDLDDRDDHARLLDFLGDADVITQGYRLGSLARRGLDATDLASRFPGIVYVSVNCYGHVGPWAERRGWEQLAQATSGMAYTEAVDGVPKITPAAATDYTTGYLAAAATIAALDRQITEGGSWLVEASLCQTAAWIQAAGTDLEPTTAPGLGDPPMTTVDTEWGTLTYLQPVELLADTPATWDQPPVPLGFNQLSWLSRPQRSK